jgi:hypothetical protein
MSIQQCAFLAESNRCLQTNDMLLVRSVGIGEDRVFSLTHMLVMVREDEGQIYYWWDFIWKLHILCDCSLSFLDRTFQIHI